jgi:RNA polymerase sigma-70 factor (TIGR02960 family)
MTTRTSVEAELAAARGGDEAAFTRLTAPFRAELQLHCYRILGSVHDAEDLLQETLLAAWQGMAGFEGRAPVRSWLYQIATRRCLNALRDRGRRPSPVPTSSAHLPLHHHGEPLDLEPYPDLLLDRVPDAAPGPDARYELREAVQLAFIVGLQRLPARQRVVLVLRDVLGFRVPEIAEMLEIGVAAVKGLLQRARQQLEAERALIDREGASVPGSDRERALTARFADAVERGDVRDIVALLSEDARLAMPPQPEEYEGHEAIAAFLEFRARLRGAALRVVPTRANGQPAFGCYLPGPGGVARAYGLLVLTVRVDGIAAITWFSDVRLFPHFRLPLAR